MLELAVGCVCLLWLAEEGREEGIEVVENQSMLLLQQWASGGRGSGFCGNQELLMVGG